MSWPWEDGRAIKLGRVLVVDSRPSMQTLMREILEPSGYIVAEAESAMQAMEMAQWVHPDLVIVELKDWRWTPVLAKALKKQHGLPELPVVALAPAASAAVPEEADGAKFAACLVQPVSPSELRKCVAGLLAANAGTVTSAKAEATAKLTSCTA